MQATEYIRDDKIKDFIMIIIKDQSVLNLEVIKWMNQIDEKY